MKSPHSDSRAEASWSSSDAVVGLVSASKRVVEYLVDMPFRSVWSQANFGSPLGFRNSCLRPEVHHSRHSGSNSEPWGVVMVNLGIREYVCYSISKLALFFLSKDQCQVQDFHSSWSVR